MVRSPLPPCTKGAVRKLFNTLKKHPKPKFDPGSTKSYAENLFNFECQIVLTEMCIHKDQRPHISAVVLPSYRKTIKQGMHLPTNNTTDNA